MMRAFVFALLWLTFASSAAASSVPAKSAFPADRDIRALLANKVSGRPGIGIVLVTLQGDRRPKIFTAGSSGRQGLPLNGDTLFEIGSITKTFTASLLVDMVRRGEVRLDDPVANHLPKTVRIPERGGRKISLLDLATHTSGLPGLPANISPKNLANPYADYTVGMLDEFLSGYALQRDIGSRYEYSAVGMGLLGRALGHRLGTRWEEALKRRILDPLGMHSTRSTLTRVLRHRLAPGHDGSGKVVANWDIPALPAMGALHSSANDMAKFLAANMNPTSRPFGAIFADAHRPRTVMDEETRVGLAWQTGHGTNRTLVWHGGGTGGYRSLIAFDPRKQIGVVLLANIASGADDIGFHLLDPALPLD
jgi:D-alanyl-D-alanine-carboxypeptidase/D-alanyl-D-alanine-endopeptidase